MVRISASVAALGLSAGAALAQSQPATVPATPAPIAAPSGQAAPDITNSNPEAPVAGANSFTQSQAQGRLAANGFADVGELFKDENGVWRGEARKFGRIVTVGVDYQGNIVSK